MGGVAHRLHDDEGADDEDDRVHARNILPDGTVRSDSRAPSGPR